MNTATIVQKLWNYCNGPGLGRSLARSPACEYAGTRKKPWLNLRDDGMSYGDYVEQLTYLLFGFGVTSRSARYEPTSQQAGTPACCLKMADERTKAPYHQKSPVPEQYGWPSLIKKDGDELFDHYRHTLEALGNQKGLLGLIFNKSLSFEVGEYKKVAVKIESNRRIEPLKILPLG